MASAVLPFSIMKARHLRRQNQFDQARFALFKFMLSFPKVYIYMAIPKQLVALGVLGRGIEDGLLHLFKNLMLSLTGLQLQSHFYRSSFLPCIKM